MPFTGPPQLIEIFKSGGGEESIDSPSAEKIYVVINTDDDVVVRTLVETGVPSVYLGLNLTNYDFHPLGNGLWDVTATWGTKKLTNLGDVVTSFDTTGGTRHITQSLQTVGAYAAPGFVAAVTDNEGAIGLDGDRVNGVDVPGPGTFTFQLSRSWPSIAMTPAKIVSIAEATFKTNSDIYYGFAVGTLLFLGASGSQRGVKDWEVTYQFAYSRNVTNMTIGSITGINKKGWEYVWCRYYPNIATTSRVLRPGQAYVERVCDEFAFASLGV
jgi:hypothetical protein